MNNEDNFLMVVLLAQQANVKIKREKNFWTGLTKAELAETMKRERRICEHRLARIVMFKLIFFHERHT